MAIDLVCYCAQSPLEAASLQSICGKELQRKFGDGLRMYDAEAVEEPYGEIAGEYGLKAGAMFMISFADKNLSVKIKNIAGIVFDVFGRQNMIVLLNNESPIE